MMEEAKAIWPGDQPKTMNGIFFQSQREGAVFAAAVSHQAS
jgi:hypothetical protein